MTTSSPNLAQTKLSTCLTATIKDESQSPGWSFRLPCSVHGLAAFAHIDQHRFHLINNQHTNVHCTSELATSSSGQSMACHCNVNMRYQNAPTEKQQHQNNCKYTTSAKWQSAHVNMPHNIAFLCLVKLPVLKIVEDLPTHLRRHQVNVELSCIIVLFLRLPR